MPPAPEQVHKLFLSITDAVILMRPEQAEIDNTANRRQ